MAEDHAAILTLLRGGPARSADLADAIGASPHNTTNDLSRLAARRLVTLERRGKHGALWRITDKGAAKVKGPIAKLRAKLTRVPTAPAATTTTQVDEIGAAIATLLRAGFIASVSLAKGAA